MLPGLAWPGTVQYSTVKNVTEGREEGKKGRGPGSVFFTWIQYNFKAELKHHNINSNDTKSDVTNKGRRKK